MYETRDYMYEYPYDTQGQVTIDTKEYQQLLMTHMKYYAMIGFFQENGYLHGDGWSILGDDFINIFKSIEPYVYSEKLDDLLAEREYHKKIWK